MKKFEELDTSKVPNMIRLVIVKTALDAMEKELHKVDDMGQLGHVISKFGDSVKQINDGIDIQGIVREVLDNQEWFKENYGSQKPS